LPTRKAIVNSADNIQAQGEALVERLYGDILQEGCVVFLGAGVTTEGVRRGSSFYEEIKKKSGYDGNHSPSFPELMQHFCDCLDGGHHNRLVREAIAYIEWFALSGEDNIRATMFSNALAEIPYFNRFVTTNWDPFLERSLDVLIPIVEDRDLGFWDDRKRQVLKIHGCITRPYSIVATQTDYDACMSRNPLIFNKLRDLMATKTFLFSGYSMHDTDFREVWDVITRSLGRFAKLAYATDPAATPEAVAFWKERGIALFRMSPFSFIRSLRDRLVADGLIPSEIFLRFIRKERRRIASIHVKLNQNSGGGFASAMYQDGLLHALDDVLASTVLGTKKREGFESDFRQAEKQVEQARREGDFIEVAYWTGRHEVVSRFCEYRKTSIPAYFHPNQLLPVSRLVKGR
jgi:hypothetical protein